MAEGIDPQEQAESARRRDRRLRARPHWDDLELRLRHRWSPRQVVAWYRERWPGERPPSVPTIYRFLQDQDAGWFLPELVDTRRLPRVLPLEEHAHLTVTQLMRVKRYLTLEEQFGMPIPEARANIALADTLLQAQFRMAQEMGLEPKLDSMAPAGGESGQGSLETLVRQIIALPTEQYLPLLHDMYRREYELHKDQAPSARPRVIEGRARHEAPENGEPAG